MAEYKTGDRVRVTKRVGPYAALEGVVRCVTPSGSVHVDMDTGDTDAYFLPKELEVFDPAPVKTLAPSLNRLLEQLETDNRRMLDVATDVQSYRMQSLYKALGEEADILGQFIAQLRWALQKDELLVKREESSND